ncbi:MAG: hypothetical protein JO236_20300 [Mycobacterium sp.]|uniref:hypothetical protein n=1 Tax=Mycobacterium sp. TaxID=1785 RepID=UPI001EB652F0|nr:hypothetical protein [Mycobacterium sp.]MBW0019873.1 hypothetical protein [Mycobacterium sp.]
MPHPRPWRWVGHGTRALAIAGAVAAAIGLAGTVDRPMVTLTAGDGLDLAPGISVTPAPGWTVEDQGSGWVILHNAFSTAELEVKIKPARGTDPVAVLQSDINQLSSLSTTGLTNVRDLSAPTSKPVQSANFQQESGIDYTADGTSRMGLIPVIGSFIELLNTSTHQSAFVVFAQNGDAPTRADNEGQTMIDSLL